MTLFGAALGPIFRPKVAAPPAGVMTPSILGTVSTDFSSVDPHQTNDFAHTVTAGTEALLLIVMYGQNNVGGNGASTPTSSVDGNFTLVGTIPAFGGSGSDNTPIVGVWIIESPTSGAHTITYGVNVATGLSYSAAACINLADIDTADIIGAVENTHVITPESNTVADSIITEKASSLVIAWGAWEKGAADPISEDLGLTQLVEVTTGIGGSTDGTISVATKTGPETPGVATYGFTASASGVYSFGAVEIRGADA